MDGASDCDSKSVLVFFVGPRAEELGAVKGSKMGEIFAENSGFRDVDGPFGELRSISFFRRIRLVETHLLRCVSFDYLCKRRNY